MELEETSIPFTPAADNRLRMPEPPPVRLVSVADVVLPAVAGMEAELDRFYCGLLRMERDAAEPGIVYRTENFRLRFVVYERPPERLDMKPTGVELPNLSDIIRQLNEAEVEYTRQKGLAAGQHSILLPDPAGNWVELFEMRPIH